MIKRYSVRKIIDFSRGGYDDILIIRYDEIDRDRLDEPGYEGVVIEGELESLIVRACDEHMVNYDNVDQYIHFCVRDPTLSHGHVDPLGVFKVS